MINSSCKPVQSLQRGLHLLEVISQSREGVFLKELAREIGCSSPAAYHLVGTLVESGFVRRLEDPARYVLGDKFLQLSARQGRDRFYRQVHHCLLRLGAALPGVALYVSEYIGGSLVVGAQVFAEKSNQIIEGGNHILPPYTSASSVVHLAFWEEEIRAEYQSRYPFEVYGLSFWKSRKAFDTVVHQARERKSVLMPQEIPSNLKLGTPLFYPGGRLAATLTLQWNLKPGAPLAQRKKQLLVTATGAAEDFIRALTPR